MVRRFSPRENGSRYELRMTPLVDVIFLLLIFFVCTAQFRPVEENLPASVQSAQTPGQTPALPPELSELDEILVQIGRHGNQIVWTFGLPGSQVQTETTSTQELKQFFAELRRVHEDLPVIVAPAAEVPLESVVTTVDIARQSGLRSVSLLTQPTEVPSQN